MATQSGPSRTSANAAFTLVLNPIQTEWNVEKKLSKKILRFMKKMHADCHKNQNDMGRLHFTDPQGALLGLSLPGVPLGGFTSIKK